MVMVLLLLVTLLSWFTAPLHCATFPVHLFHFPLPLTPYLVYEPS